MATAVSTVVPLSNDYLLRGPCCSGAQLFHGEPALPLQAGAPNIATIALDPAPLRESAVLVTATVDSTSAAKASVFAYVYGFRDGALVSSYYAFLPLGRGEHGARLRFFATLPIDADRAELTIQAYGSDGALSVSKLAVERRYSVAPTMAPAARAYVGAVLDTMQANALVREERDWDRLRRLVLAAADGAGSTQQTYPALRFATALLADGHSRFLPPREFRELLARTPAAVEVRLLDHNVGYVRVPGFSSISSADRLAFSRHASGQLAALPACAFIVDLRDDVGGAIAPMLDALAPLLGKGPVGYFQRPQQVRTPWLPAAAAIDLAASPVAVLLGPATASAGEAVAVAFAGRQHTRSFGQTTAGMATGVASHRMGDGAWLNLSESFYLDRNGVVYNPRINPDEFVAAGEGDPPLAAALQWLSTACPLTQRH